MAEPIILRDLRGGLNDSSSPADLLPDQLVICENIDFDRAACGAKRRGSSDVSNDYAAVSTSVTFLFRHTPVNDERYTELWAAGPASGAAVMDLRYRDNTGWHIASWGADLPIVASGSEHINAQSLHGKLFMAYPAADGGVPTDRLFIRRPGETVIRRAGLRMPTVAPTVVESGSGAYVGTRYARYRVVEVSGSTVLRRSEPSPVSTLVPTGSAALMRVTCPTVGGQVIGETETHWEVELSMDNVNFYRVTRLALSTPTYDDTAATYLGGTLSEDIGDYTLLWSAKFLSADEDRLLIAGAWLNVDYKSRLGWTPVAQAPGVSNDERLELDTDPFLDLDGFEGGELTGLKGPVNGYHYAFKNSHIYKIVRTGKRSQAYEAFAITKRKGAIERSIVEGEDANGNPCIYFADPKLGPHRLGVNGVEDLGHDIRSTWARVNKNARMPCHAAYYPDKKQVWFWVALDGANAPTHKLVVFVKELRRTEGGTRRGWSVHDGLSGKALCSTLYSYNLNNVPSDLQALNVKPYFGVAASDVGTGSAQDLIQQADVDDRDNDAVTFKGRMRTRPMILKNLLQKAGVRAGSVLALAASGSSVDISLFKDHQASAGVTKHISLTPAAGESRVTVLLDDLALSEMYALQVEIVDSGNAASANTWEIDQISLIVRDEEGH